MTAARRLRTALGVVATVVVLGLTVGPRVLHYQVTYIRSGSMSPAIDVGALAVLRPTAADRLKVGDVISFNRPDRSELVIHRIVGEEQTPEGRVWLTKGDANGMVDGWRVPATGAGSRVAHTVPKVGYVMGLMATPLWRYVVLVWVTVTLAAMALISLWRPKMANAQKALIRP